VAHSGLTWVCSRCRRERAEGQPHVCKTAEERPPVPRCTCVRPQLILEGDATETCPDCRGVRHAGSGGEASPKATSAPAQAPASPVPPERLAPASTLDALASRLEDAVGAAQEQAAPGHLLCTAALEVAEVLRVLSATVPPGAPPAALGASTPEASPADRDALPLPPSIEQMAHAMLGAELEALAGGSVPKWLQIRAKAFAAKLKGGQDVVDALGRMGSEAFAAGQSTESAWLLQLLDEQRRGARRRERRVLKALRHLLTKGEG